MPGEDVYTGGSSFSERFDTVCTKLSKALGAAVFIGCWAAMGHVRNGGTDHGLRMRDDAMRSRNAATG